MIKLIMNSQKQKLIAGELYLASDEELVKDRINARLLLRKLNTAMPDTGRRCFRHYAN
ncbi:maltose acetyltransferase domain-containing protein [Flavobacterium sp.]|uniref:maltose acetyltransferase domain-containing protein n=1 Tax=Flavobacterium sp. TaxID=239 RepID=UPI0040345C5A